MMGDCVSVKCIPLYFYLLTKFIRSICYIKENRNKRLHKFIDGFMTKHIDCDDSNT